MGGIERPHRSRDSRGGLEMVGGITLNRLRRMERKPRSPWGVLGHPKLPLFLSIHPVGVVKGGVKKSLKVPLGE